MGQKTNSNILRLKISNTNWKSKYYAKTTEESSLYIYNDLQIKKYLNRVFQIYGLIIQTYKYSYSNTILKIFFSFFITLRYLKACKKVKKYSSQHYNFSENILESLTIYTKKKAAIVLIIQNLNKGWSLKLTAKQLQFLKKSSLKLRKFSKNFVFKETINIILISLKKKNSAKLLSEFLAFQITTMKKQNYFLLLLKRLVSTFLNTRFFTTKGIKILIKGRINGAPRARTNTIILGQIPLQNFKANINYNTTTSFTTNGTFGIKVWIQETSKIR